MIFMIFSDFIFDRIKERNLQMIKMSGQIESKSKMATTTTTNEIGDGRNRKCRNVCKIITVCLAVLLLVMIFMYCFWFDSLIKFLNHLPGTRHLPDTNRNIFELIESRGFKHESHYIQTGNGYILLMVRIIHPNIEDRHQLKPVYLQHGFVCTGTFWLVSNDGHLSADGRTYYETIDDRIISNSSNGDVGNSLGFVLAARGYDVWLGNYRGSIYSTNHTTLDPATDSKFWEFSMDEMIEEDLKSNVDYIMQQTGRASISYVGHSQGSLMMLALLSKHPRYSDHVKPFVAVAPAFFSSRFETGLFRLAPLGLLHRFLRKRPGPVPIGRKFIVFTGNACENILLRRVCYWLHDFACATNLKHNILNRIGTYWNNVMMGSSNWNMIHFYQINMFGGQPHHFDYGDPAKNLAKYGTEIPPIYNASNINSTDIALIYSKEDHLNPLDDVERLKKNLRVKPIVDHLIPDETMDHADQVRSNSSGRLVHGLILDILSKY